MIIKTYPDGSEMTVSMLAGAVVVSAIGATALFLGKERYDRMKSRRWRNQA